jgi:hypothetical protein
VPFEKQHGVVNQGRPQSKKLKEYQKDTSQLGQSANIAKTLEQRDASTSPIVTFLQRFDGVSAVGALS